LILEKVPFLTHFSINTIKQYSYSILRISLSAENFKYRNT